MYHMQVVGNPPALQELCLQLEFSRFFSRETGQKILVTRVFPGPSRSAHFPRYVFWVIFKMDGENF